MQMFSSVVAFIYIVLCPRIGIFDSETHVKGVRVKKSFSTRHVSSQKKSNSFCIHHFSAPSSHSTYSSVPYYCIKEHDGRDTNKKVEVSKQCKLKVTDQEHSRYTSSNKVLIIKSEARSL